MNSLPAKTGMKPAFFTARPSIHPVTETLTSELQDARTEPSASTDHNRTPKHQAYPGLKLNWRAVKQALLCNGCADGTGTHATTKAYQQPRGLLARGTGLARCVA